MSDLSDYWARQTETKLAQANHAKANYQVEIARMKERAAELRSQHEPLAGLVNGAFKGPNCAEPDDVRAAINDAIFYVLVGRFPTKS